jgi:carboxyl-terminal processing protease
MRRIILVVAILVSAVPLSARPLERTPAPPADGSDSRNYAAQLSRVLNTVSTQYIRPVSTGDLALAALEGLYEGAGLPVPTALTKELKALQDFEDMSKDAEELLGLVFERLPERVQQGAIVGLESLKARRDLCLLDVFARHRAAVGDVEELRGHGALFQSIRGMTRVLDPYTGLVDGREWARGSADDSAPGFGLELAENHGVGPLVVKNVVPGGPAQRAGLRPGDRITHVHGKPVHGKPSPFRLTSVSKGGPPPVPPPPVAPPRGAAVPVPVLPGGPVRRVEPVPITFTYIRSDDDTPRTVRLEPQAFKGETVLGVIRNEDNSWDYWVDRKHKIAHVRIASLAAGTSEDLMQVIGELQQQGMRGLILDLRWCPGGFLNEAVNVALMFVGSRKVASVKTRDGNQVDYAQTSGLSARPNFDEKKLQELPLIVLVNGTTSGGAELIAAAIQDNKRGRIAGQRTLGKASVQTPIDLVDDCKLKLTTGTFSRPSGKNLHRFPDSKDTDDWGVHPNARLEFRVSRELDRQLRGWWQLQTLRPGTSREALPLDDPGADCQRQRSVDALRGQLSHKKKSTETSARMNDE